jgi:hypothetical protein
MTQTIEKKVAKLTETTKMYMPRVRKKENTPFATSAAKYYPALKRLAEK